MAQNDIKQTPSSASRRLNWKFLPALFIVIFASIALLWFLLPYMAQLTDKDFAAVEQKMHTVYNNMHLQNVSKTKTCYYYKDNMGKYLKCAIDMTGDVPLDDPAGLPDIAKRFERQLQPMSTTEKIWQLSDEAHGVIESGSFSVKDSKLNMGCTASVHSSTGEVPFGPDVPGKSLKRKATLKLACGGGSREPYFEMR